MAVTNRRTLILLIGALAVAVRLIAIDQPFVDQWSWRQSDVAAIARNFYQHGFRFAHPQIDWAGNAEGYVGTEFPILPFVAAGCYTITGIHEWVGRLQAVLFFAASVPFFYLLVRDVFGALAAVWAVIFYGFAPLNTVAGRAFMPDVPSMALSIAGLYLFLRYTDLRHTRLLIASALLTGIAMLIKLPTAVIGAALLSLALRLEAGTTLRDSDQPLPQSLTTSMVRLIRRPDLWLFAAIALVPSAIWYFHAYRISEAFYPHHFFGAGGVRLMAFSWYWQIAVQTATATLTPTLAILALGGCVVAGRARAERLFHWWLAAMVMFIVVVGWGNRHQWYQLPLVPIAAAFGGCACAYFSNVFRSQKLLRALLAIGVIASFAGWSYAFARPIYSDSAESARQLGFELKRRTRPDALVVAANNGDPTVFYYAERKGWHFLEKEGVFDGNPFDSAQLIADLDELRARGATHLVFDWSTRWWLDYYVDFAQHLARRSKLIEKTSDFSIYELTDVHE